MARREAKREEKERVYICLSWRGHGIELSMRVCLLLFTRCEEVVCVVRKTRGALIVLRYSGLKQVDNDSVNPQIDVIQSIELQSTRQPSHILQRQV